MEVGQRFETTLALLGMRGKERRFWLALVFACWTSVAFAVTDEPVPMRTNEPIYQNPFDIASGGANLTRATQDGVMFANPSLTAFGPGVFRWFFLRTGLHLGADSVELAYGIAKSKGQVADPAALIQKVIKTPIYAGFDFSLGALTRYGGIGAFISTRVDLAGRQYGSMGFPEIRARGYGYGGAVLTNSGFVGDWLALGYGLRYQGNAELYKTIGLVDMMSGSGASALGGELRNAVKYGYGAGLDLGATTQYRTKNFDFRWATTVNDVGQTKFTGNLAPWKQTVSTGVGVIYHTRSSALHCAVDVRDLEAAYGEHWTRRSYAGCKALLSKRVGVGAGLYQGWMSYGVVLSALFIRLEAGTYTKEMGSQVGTDPRRVYFVALGSEI
jgi:hypothetical protein